jgi:glycosyltransferase involved in cell wall biosynthesis
MTRRLLFISYAGDYRDVVRRFAIGEQETYYCQKYSVDAIAKLGSTKLSQHGDEVAMLCCLTTTRYDEIMDNGVRAIGAGFNGNNIDPAKLVRLVADFNPTHLVLRTPIPEVLRWAIRHNVKIIVTLADSFNSKSIRNFFSYTSLARLLNHRSIDWVTNHGITASMSLKSIGVDANKIIPWDWPHAIKPSLFPPKSIAHPKISWNVIFVGAVVQDKGIGDLLEAVEKLRSKGFPITLKVIGKGEVDRYRQQAKDLKIDDCVEFLGILPNSDIVPQMRSADAVVVASRHSCPEGFPMTIYEALCSRSPIVISNHPMFCDKLTHGVNALIFQSGRPQSLAACLEQLFSSPDLYQALSIASEQAWQSLQLPTEGVDLVNRWLTDSEEDNRWLFQHRLASGRYLAKQNPKAKPAIATKAV